jgi:hypothetical protein
VRRLHLVQPSGHRDRSAPFRRSHPAKPSGGGNATRCKHRWTTFERDEAVAADAREKALAHLGAAQAILARG